MNLEETKAFALGQARIFHDSETFPHAFVIGADGTHNVLALALPVRDGLARTLDAVRATSATIAIHIAECWAPAEDGGLERQDIVAVMLDHPEGMWLGRIEVDDARTPRLGEVSWTPDYETPHRERRFPRVVTSLIARKKTTT